MNGTELRDGGRRASYRGKWLESYEHLRAAVVVGDVPLEPEDLEWLAIAAYLTGHDGESTDAWTLAHHAWLGRGAHAPAVRCAFWAGFGLPQRGEMAQGGGWLARGGTVLSQHGLDCVEWGYLLLPEARVAMGGGDLDGALERFGQAGELAQRFGDRDLVALGRIGRGEALLRSGRARDGMRLFDEAMVSVTAGETSPVVSGVVYCAVIDACQQAFDLRRAREWTAARPLVRQSARSRAVPRAVPRPPGSDTSGGRRVGRGDDRGAAGVRAAHRATASGDRHGLLRAG